MNHTTGSRKQLYRWLLAVLISACLAASVPTAPAQARNDTKVFLPLVSTQAAIQACNCTIPYQPPVDATIEAKTLSAINAQRTQRGLKAVAQDDALVQIARYHSNDMALHNFTEHNGSAGEDWSVRYTWTGESWSYTGEILAWNFGNVTDLINDWMNSPAHRSIILDPHYTYAGVGYAKGPNGTYWTVDFGAH